MGMSSLYSTVGIWVQRLQQGQYKVLSFDKFFISFHKLKKNIKKDS